MIGEGIARELRRSILKDAVEKAIAGGWRFFDWVDAEDFTWEVVTGDVVGGLRIDTDSSIDWLGWHPNIIIFDHDFAKALWGTAKVEDIKQRLLQKYWDSNSDQTLFDDYLKAYGETLWDGGPEFMDFTGEAWQYHLQNMVVAPDPIAYLGNHI